MTHREIIIDAMAEQGMTQQALADKSGVPRPNISKYLGGKTSPTIDTVERLLTALRIPCPAKGRKGK